GRLGVVAGGAGGGDEILGHLPALREVARIATDVAVGLLENAGGLGIRLVLVGQPAEDVEKLVALAVLGLGDELERRLGGRLRARGVAGLPGELGNRDLVWDDVARAVGGDPGDDRL